AFLADRVGDVARLLLDRLHHLHEVVERVRDLTVDAPEVLAHAHREVTALERAQRTEDVPVVEALGRSWGFAVGALVAVLLRWRFERIHGPSGVLGGSVQRAQD